MSNTDWNLGPVLKQKPGSQGTLFRGGTKYSSPLRYPRGYTPERQAEVRAAVQPAWIDSAGTKFSQPAQQQRREIADTLARSTAPVEHLQGVQWAHVGPKDAITADDSAAGAYFHGYTQPPSGDGDSIKGKPDVVRAPIIGVKPAFTRTNVVLHEVGHHVSALQGNEHASGKNYSYTSEHGGKEEAFADNYAEEHFRDRRGKQVERGIYGGGRFAGRIDRSESFWDGYGKNRTWEMSRQRVAAEDENYYRKYPEERQHPDGSYDQPLINKPYTSEGEKPYMEINSEAMPHRKWWE